MTEFARRVEPVRAKITVDGKIFGHDSTLKVLGCEMFYGNNRRVEKNLNRFRCFCGTVRPTVDERVRKETLLNLRKEAVVRPLSHGCKTWTLKEQII
jgi:hypothetical protein